MNPMRPLVAVSLAGVSGFWAAVARGEDAGAGSAFGSSLQAVAALLAVIAAIFGLAWLAKRLSAAPGRTNLVRVLSAAAVGTRERVVVVEVGESWLVVGVASGQVNLLHTMPRGEIPPPRAAAAAGSFVEKLREVRLRHGQPS